MTPGARLASSIELYEKIWSSRIPMDKTCADYFRIRRHIGAKDRAEIAERVYGLMRHHARLNWWLEHMKLQGVRASVLLYALLYEEMTAKRIADLCSGRKYEAEPLSDEEQRALALLADGDYRFKIEKTMPEAVSVECPPDAEEFLRAKFGADFALRLSAMMTAAPLDLRVNTLKATREEAKARLEAEGVKTDPMTLSPWGLRVQGKAFLSVTKSFSKGWIEIQDEGSQLIALICDAKPGEQVLDFCAGAGGKTLALAAAMENKGRVVAMDLDPDRLEKGRTRYRKAGVHNIELRALNDPAQTKWLRRQKEKFDCVLVDAPCSSSGTWRRNPDLKWRRYGPSFTELNAIQADILDQVAYLVKPGGRLVYATCSLNPLENEDIVNDFLARHDAFSLTEEDPSLYDHFNQKGFFARKMIKK